MHVGSVMLDMVNPHEPRVLRIDERQFSLAILKRGMAQGHVIGNGVQFATSRNFQVTLLTCYKILAQEETAIWFTMSLLKHFAFASAASPFVHDRYDIIVWRNDLNSRTVVRDPSFALTQAQ